MKRILIPVILLLAALVGCLPARDFQEATPSEATFTLEAAGDAWQFTLLLGASPAVCVPGVDDRPACTTFTLMGTDITSQNAACASLAPDTLRCIVPDTIETGYRITVNSDDRPVGVVALMLQSDRTQALFLDAK